MTAVETNTAKPGVTLIEGVEHMKDAKGAFVPRSVIRAQDQLQDELVRKIIGFASPLSEQVSRFKRHAFEDIHDFLGVLAQEYEETRGGEKGNMTFMSYDGCMKVSVQVAEHISFGPELQIGKSLFDECLNDWSSGSTPELKAVVTKAFNTDKEGKINISEILSLLRLEIQDERWKKAVQATRDAMRVVGTKSYVRCYTRADAKAAWEPIVIDVAKA